MYAPHKPSWHHNAVFSVEIDELLELLLATTMVSRPFKSTFNFVFKSEGKGLIHQGMDLLYNPYCEEGRKESFIKIHPTGISTNLLLQINFPYSAQQEIYSAHSSTLNHVGCYYKNVPQMLKSLLTSMAWCNFIQALFENSSACLNHMLEYEESSLTGDYCFEIDNTR